MFVRGGSRVEVFAGGMSVGLRRLSLNGLVALVSVKMERVFQDGSSCSLPTHCESIRMIG